MKKLLALTLALILVLGILPGCSLPTPLPVDSGAPTTQAPKTEAPTTQAPVTEAPTEAPATEPVGSDVDPALLEGLTINDAAIVIDGVLYKSEDPYSKMVENGWDFSFDDYYNVDENYVLNKGQYVYATIRLYNMETYGKGPSITIGFINNNEEATKLKECDIHGIKVEGTSGFKRYEDLYTPVACYDFMLWNGLRRGDSMEKVKEVMGEPTDPDSTYVADGDGYHYEIMTYKGDHVSYELTVFTVPDIGLQSVEISDTRNWTR